MPPKPLHCFYKWNFQSVLWEVSLQISKRSLGSYYIPLAGVSMGDSVIHHEKKVFQGLSGPRLDAMGSTLDIFTILETTYLPRDSKEY